MRQTHKIKVLKHTELQKTANKPVKEQAKKKALVKKYKVKVKKYKARVRKLRARLKIKLILIKNK